VEEPPLPSESPFITEDYMLDKDVFDIEAVWGPFYQREPILLHHINVITWARIASRNARPCHDVYVMKQYGVDKGGLECPDPIILLHKIASCRSGPTRMCFVTRLFLRFRELWSIA
jgi:hypothetical protein